ncbi:MAG: DUF5683 domain-containing protein [Rhodothermales bacterium]
MRLLLLLSTGLILPSPTLSFAQVDTTRTTPLDTTAIVGRGLPATHSPRGALWRSAVLPGWGQFYNRQHLKIPIVYLGLGGLTAAALSLNNQYLRYRHAFLYKANQELVDQEQIEKNPWPQYEQEYRDLIADIASGRELASSTLRAQRDSLRRNRDLLYFGIGFWYMLSLLDAYVSAHLLDFDVSEDLTLSFSPHPPISGLSATIRLGL